MEKQIYAVGDRVEKLCLICSEERGHVVASVTKRGQISRVNCPKCGTRSTFKRSGDVPGRVRSSAKDGAPYDWTLTYRAGQTMLHPSFGLGEVTAIVEMTKIDVLFEDRIRRLVHARART